MIDYEPYIQVAKERSSKDPAHDFLHVQRVLKNAQIIVAEITADMEIITPAILLHELFNYPKGHPESKYSGDVCAEQANEVLKKFEYPEHKRDQVLDCIRYHSYSRGVVPLHIEGKIVQDADRLDAIGAIGIARLFATSAEMHQPFYHFSDPFGESREWNDKQYGVDHFYCKLLKLAEGMHTKPARELAIHRTEYMKGFIEQLRSEIE